MWSKTMSFKLGIPRILQLLMNGHQEGRSAVSWGPGFLSAPYIVFAVVLGLLYIWHDIYLFSTSPKHEAFMIGTVKSKDSKGFELYITTAPIPDLNDKLIVFGRVVKGEDVVQVNKIYVWFVTWIDIANDSIEANLEFMHLIILCNQEIEEVDTDEHYQPKSDVGIINVTLKHAIWGCMLSYRKDFTPSQVSCCAIDFLINLVLLLLERLVQVFFLVSPRLLDRRERRVQRNVVALFKKVKVCTS